MSFIYVYIFCEVLDFMLIVQYWMTHLFRINPRAVSLYQITACLLIYRMFHKSLRKCHFKGARIILDLIGFVFFSFFYLFTKVLKSLREKEKRKRSEEKRRERRVNG